MAGVGVRHCGIHRLWIGVGLDGEGSCVHRALLPLLVVYRVRRCRNIAYLYLEVGGCPSVGLNSPETHLSVSRCALPLHMRTTTSETNNGWFGSCILSLLSSVGGAGRVFGGLLAFRRQVPALPAIVTRSLGLDRRARSAAKVTEFEAHEALHQCQVCLCVRLGAGGHRVAFSPTSKARGRGATAGKGQTVGGSIAKRGCVSGLLALEAKSVWTVKALVSDASAQKARSLLLFVGALVRHVPAATAVEAPNRSLLKVLVKIPWRSQQPPHLRSHPHLAESRGGGWLAFLHLCCWRLLLIFLHNTLLLFHWN
mmetsp:Transcript_32133/g.44556  ORF Transcript_32133/g.44556 Transcript_32133/m.44556 type:complete len:311 (+) Transcript_32133:502-1434(+)